MASHDEANVYREGSKVVFRMSSFGSCIKQLSAALAGLEPAPAPAVLQKAYAAGHDYEDYILEQVEIQYASDVTMRQATWEFKLGKTIVFRGHPDGAVETSTFDAIVDAKNLGKSYFTSFERQGLAGLGHLGMKYALQGILYCLAGGYTVFILAMRSKETDEVLCVEYDIEELWEFTGLSMRGLRMKANAVIKAAGDGNILGAECEEEVWGCPFFYLHNDTGEEGLWLEDMDVTPAEAEVIGGLINADTLAKVKFDEAETAKKTARKALQNFINNQAPMPDVLTADTKETVKWKYEADDGTKIGRHQSSSSALDHAALKEAGIDINDYQKKSFHPVLRVTLPKENEND
jgi:hypothetical protein